MCVRLLIIVSFITCAACDFIGVKAEKVAPESVTEKITPSPENCLKNCKSMQEACVDFEEKQSQCERSQSESDCLQVLKSFSVMHGASLSNTFSCKDSCWDVSNNNRLEICGAGEEERFDGLSDRFMNVVMTNPASPFKALGLSERLLKLKNKKFNERYDRLNKEKLPFEMPKIHIVQERSEGQKHFEIWLRKKELNCLSKSLKNKIKKMQIANPSSLGFDLSSSYAEVSKSCGLSKLKPFGDNEEGVQGLKFKKMEYFVKRPERDDCHYEIPRIVISFKGEEAPTFLAHRDFKRIEDYRLLSLLTTLDDYRRLYYGFAGPLSFPFSYKGRKFTLVSVPSMAVSYELLEVTDYGLRKVSTAIYQEPCGS